MNLPFRHIPLRRRLRPLLTVLVAGLLPAAPGRAADFTSWAHRMQVTFAGYAREEALTNFPALVVFSNRPGFAYTQFLSDDHGDLRFTDASMTNELPYEVESWDTNGASFVWVQVPELTGTGTCVWAFWGLAGTNAEAYTTNGAVWDSSFVGVWHMVQVNARDSTSNRFDGVASGTVAQAPGIANGANSFSNTTDRITVPDSPSFTFSNSPYTVSAWINLQTPTNYNAILGTYGAPGFILALSNASARTLWFYDSTWQSSTVSIPTGVWKQVAYARDGSNGVFYVDGLPVKTVAAVPGSNGGPLVLGQGGTNATWGALAFRGSIDEVCLSTSARSSNWMWAAYMNLASNAAFTTTFLGAPDVSNLPPASPSNVSALAQGILMATGYPPTTVTCCWGTNDGGTVMTNWEHLTPVDPVIEGPVSVLLTNLTPNQTYWYAFLVSNAIAAVWAQPSISFQTWGPPAVDNAGGASPIGATVAMLNGTLLDGLGAEAFFLWGPAADALTNRIDAGVVTEGSFSIMLTGLQSSATYYYCASASNAYGTATAASTDQFSTAATTPFLYVATNAPAGGDGSTWASAFREIQPALDAAHDGDEIRLAGNTFWITNELRWLDRTNVQVSGGWEGIGDPGSNNPSLWPTVIRRDPAAGTRLLTVGSVTGALMGVTIQDGLITSSPYYGGGLRVTNSTFTLDNCRIAGNTVSGIVAATYYYGGGLYASESVMRITNCTFSQNVAYSREGGGSRVWGGGCMINGGAAEIVDSTFETNALTGKGHNVGGHDFCYGGGVFSSGSSTTTIRNCVFRGNTQFGRGTTAGGQNPRAYLRGGAVYAAGAVSIHDTIIRDNSLYASVSPGDSRGGGLYATGPLSLMNVMIMNNAARSVTGGDKGDAIGAEGVLSVTNCTVVKNGVIVSGRQGIWVAGTSPVAVVNSIVRHNGDDLVGFPTNAVGILTNVWNCNIEDGDNAGVQGCSSADPAFDHGHYLATNSPCVDAGSDTAANLGLDAYTTRADGLADSGIADIGYHPRTGMDPAAADLYVAGTGSDANSGTNSAEAFRSITRALAAAQDGTYIHIGAGLYTNTVETFPLALRRWGLRLIGSNSADCIVNATGANSRVITVSSVGEVSLQGLTIRGGRYTSANPTQGGGIYAAYSTLRLRDCRIETNSLLLSASENMTLSGAGVYAYSCAMSITNCVIANNTLGDSSGRGNAYYGAGCMIDACEPLEIVDTVFLKNASKGRGYSGNGDTANQGGGLYASRPVALRNCLVQSNSVSGSLGTLHGAGIFAGSTLTLDRCDVRGNQGIGEQNSQSATPQENIYGGGLYAAGALVVSTTTIAGNTINSPRTGATYGGGVYAAAAADLRNVVLAGNRASASNGVSNYGGGLYAAGGLTAAHVTAVSNQVSGIHRAGSGAVSLVNAIVWGNGDDLFGFPTNDVGVLTNVFYCDIGNGDNTGVNGCVSVNPGFTDSTYYHLASRIGCYAGGYFSGGYWTTSTVNSVLVDAGDPVSAYDQEPLPNGRRANLGAYGNTPVASMSPSRNTLILLR